MGLFETQKNVTVSMLSPQKDKLPRLKHKRHTTDHSMMYNLEIAILDKIISVNGKKSSLSTELEMQ